VKHRLLLLSAAVLFSTGGAVIKLSTLTSWQVACFRCLVAAISLLLFFPQSFRSWSRRHVPISFAYAGTLILFAIAAKLTTAALAIFLQSTAPAYLFLIGPWLLHEALRKEDFFLLGGMSIGLLLCLGGGSAPLATAPDPQLGNILALLSGVTWALTVAGLRWLGRGSQDFSAAASTIIVGNLLAFVISLPMALPIYSISNMDLATVLFLGFFQVALAYLCLSRGLQGVPALEASIFLLLEPALNPLWAFLIMKEIPTSGVIAGGVCILLSTALNTWWRAPKRKLA
jgi:DME family drug/metabolite transporter